MTIVINRRVAHVTLIAAAVAVVAWVGWCRVAPGRMVIDGDRLTALDPANAGINIRVTQPWFNDTVMVLDVRSPGQRDFDRFDVTRCLLQCAQDLKHSDAKRVYLANDGCRMYYISGDDFRKLGADYERGNRWNNTMLATRIPTVTHTLNDSLAFAVHDGIIQPLDNASDWNTMMSTLIDHDNRSLPRRLLSLLL